jgi:iron complex transport system substrate-binding protein
MRLTSAIILASAAIPLTALTPLPAGGSGAVEIANIHYDLTGNTETFAKAPERVLSVNGSATELILSLGQGGRLVGTAYQDNPPMPGLQDAYARIPVISRRYPGKEQALGLGPDLIVGWQSAFAPGALGDTRYWNRLGVATFILRDSSALPKSFANIRSDITDLGRIFRAEDRAGSIVSSIDSELESLRLRAAGRGGKPGALVLECYPGGRMRSWGDDSTPGQMLLAAGARNLFPRTGDVSKEAIAKADPDAVVFIYMDSALKDTEQLMADFRTDRILRWTKASRDGRMGLVPLSEAYCPGVRLADGLRRMSGILYPAARRGGGRPAAAAPGPGAR